MVSLPRRRSGAAAPIVTEDQRPQPPSPGGLVGRLDRFQRRFPSAGFPLACVYKFVDDTGGFLAALVAYYAFVSLFPLLLLLTTLLGLALSGDAALQQRIIDSALSQFPVVGEQLGDPQRLSGGTIGLVIGVVGALYGGLGVGQALQHAMNTMWSVPRNERPNPLAARGRGLVLLGTVGVAVLGTTALSAVGASHVGSFGPLLRAVVLVVSMLVNAGAFVLAFRIATIREVSIRDVLPGALTAAVAWQLLQTFGITYVSRVVAGSSATNGVFALVLGLIAFLYLTAVVVLLCVEINVVRVERLWPRALLTPFTDDVQLTGGDRRAYTDLAKAQRSKGFEKIDVSFDQEPPDAPPSDAQPSAAQE